MALLDNLLAIGVLLFFVVIIWAKAAKKTPSQLISELLKGEAARPMPSRQGAGGMTWEQRARM